MQQRTFGLPFLAAFALSACTADFARAGVEPPMPDDGSEQNRPLCEQNRDCEALDGRPCVPCNAVTGAPCSGGEGCYLYVAGSGRLAAQCFSAGRAALGERCDRAQDCAAGLICSGGICLRSCCWFHDPVCREGPNSDPAAACSAIAGVAAFACTLPDWGCDPIRGSRCANQGDGCYATTGGTSCLRPSPLAVARDGSCCAVTDCRTGLTCLRVGSPRGPTCGDGSQPGICLPLCSLRDGGQCERGRCHPMYEAPGASAPLRNIGACYDEERE